MELVNKIAEMSPLLLAMAKTSVKNAARMNLHEPLDPEVDLLPLCLSSEDKEEGVRAFIENASLSSKTVGVLRARFL